MGGLFEQVIMEKKNDQARKAARRIEKERKRLEMGSDYQSSGDEGGFRVPDYDDDYYSDYSDEEEEEEEEDYDEEDETIKSEKQSQSKMEKSAVSGAVQ